jgi:hypothetical protein
MKKAIIILTMLIGMIGTTQATPHYPLIAKPEYVYICISRTAHKYHSRSDCRGLMRCTHEEKMVTKATAIRMGYTACKICY